MLIKSYKYRIYPTKDQIILLNKTFGCTRFIYNKMLEDRINHYVNLGTNLYNHPAQYKTEFPWLKEVDSLALSNTQLQLNSAYSKFFKYSKVGFPNFKKKRNSRKSYTTSNNSNKLGSIRIVDKNNICIPKIPKLKIKLHRQIPEYCKIKSATISLEPTGKYYISILTESDYKVQQQITPVNIVGLDFSMKELYVDSEGNEGNYPRFYRQTQKKLALEQKILSKRTKGSGRYLKQKIKVAKIQGKVANQRKDYLHKKSTVITKQYDAVVIESLNMKAMSQTLNFGKSVADNGWGMFTNMLNYKLKEEGKQLIKIDKWFPSTKMCSHCGHKKTEIKLSERIYVCEHCGNIMNRDLNAATNIFNIGCTMLGIKIENNKTTEGHSGIAQDCLDCKQPSTEKIYNNSELPHQEHYIITTIK